MEFSGGLGSGDRWCCAEYFGVSKYPCTYVMQGTQRGGALSRRNLKKPLQPFGSSLQPS